MSIVATLAVAVLLGGCEPASKAQTPEQRAAAYLVRHQDSDGAWRSPTHGIVRGGAAWTPFLTSVLQHYATATLGSERPTIEASINQSLAAIRVMADDAGALGRTDRAVLEYPNYSTSYALIALTRANLSQDSLLVQKMRHYLQSQQWSADRGVDGGHVAFGGWGFGETSFAPGSVGHVDLSHTRRALEALRPDSASDVSRSAQQFLALAQKLPTDRRSVIDGPQPVDAFDGGFYASPVVFGTNKGGVHQTATGARYFRSYATATCDGILALLAAGTATDDPRVVAALSWLEQHPAIDRVPGIPEAERGQWEDVMFFYHLNVRAEVLSRLKPGHQLLRDIRDMVVAAQREDGSFANPLGGPNKEDDPLLATAFALSALLYTSAA